MYRPVFAIADEDLLRWAEGGMAKVARRVARDYDSSERATVVLVGPLDGLGVASSRRNPHSRAAVCAIAVRRLRALMRERRAS